MNPPNLQTVSLYTLTLREVMHREALIYTMPTVAAGGGQILNTDFCCKFVKEATGQRAARKDKYPSDNEEEEEEEEQGKETIPKQGKTASVAEALADTQAELEAQSAIPSSGKESRKESVDSAKLQSDGALNEVIKMRLKD